MVRARTISYSLKLVITQLLVESLRNQYTFVFLGSFFEVTKNTILPDFFSYFQLKSIAKLINQQKRLKKAQKGFLPAFRCVHHS